jgi:hypothetical protein
MTTTKFFQEINVGVVEAKNLEKRRKTENLKFA